jgi:hypothetical protein
VLLDAAAIDEGAVGTRQIGELVDLSFAANLGMPPLNFRVVYPDRVRSVPTQAYNIVFQFKSVALIVTLNNK